MELGLDCTNRTRSEQNLRTGVLERLWALKKKPLRKFFIIDAGHHQPVDLPPQLSRFTKTRDFVYLSILCLPPAPTADFLFLLLRTMASLFERSRPAPVLGRDNWERWFKLSPL